MQLPDEAITYLYQSLLFQAKPDDEWRPALELQSKHFLSPQRLKDFIPQVNQARTQVALERDSSPAAGGNGLNGSFIDWPEKMIADFRRRQQESQMQRLLATADLLRQHADRIVILGTGGSYLGARALFEAFKSSHHNELLPEQRLGTPRIYFEGNSIDNEAMQDLLDLLQNTCVNPDLREERWGVIVVSKTGTVLETAAALRILRREAHEYYGSKSPWPHHLFVAVTGESDSSLRSLFKADGFPDDAVFTIPERVGDRFSVFTPAGLLPAAVMGLDVRAMLLGAASATRQFLDEPFERNPVLQMAAVNYLMTEEIGKPIRVLSVWSKKLEALGLWYDQLVAESLGKRGLGPTPITVVTPRDLHCRGQQHHEGRRDKLIVHLVVKKPKMAPIALGMADRNEDGLNAFSRKTYPDLLQAAFQGTDEAYAEAARPTATITVPALNEHTLGQLMQMLMLATVVEGRLLGINPYSQPTGEIYQRNLLRNLKTPAPSPKS